MDKIQEIEAKIDKIITILNQLYNQLYLGYCSFVLTQKIQLALVAGRIVHMQELLKTTYFACGNAAILVPRTLVEEGNRKQNININFLFREWEEIINTVNKIIKKRIVDKNSLEKLWQNQKGYLVVLRQRNDILDAITKYKQKIKSLEPTLAALEEKRSNNIAHLSKKLLQTGRIEQPLYTDDLNEVYQELFDIIQNSYKFVGENIEIENLETLHKLVESDFDYLMR